MTKKFTKYHHQGKHERDDLYYDEDETDLKPVPKHRRPTRNWKKAWQNHEITEIEEKDEFYGRE